MTLKECYALLGVAQSATLEEVKRGYRKRAFEWHPDLNPQLGDAGRRFQQLNEAYVILTKLITAREARDEKLRTERTAKTATGHKRTAGHGPSASGDSRGGQPTASADPESDSAQRRDDADERARQQAEAEQKARAAKAEQAAQAAETERTAKDEKAARDEARTTEQASAQSEEPRTDKEASRGDDTRSRRSTTDSAGEKVYAEQQEVLRDILNDPFARRVFEDIYSAIRQKGHDSARQTAQNVSASKPEPKNKGFLGFGLGGGKPRTTGGASRGAQASGQTMGQPGQAPGQVSGQPAGQASGRSGDNFWGSMLGFGQGRAGFDLSKGVGGAVKGWLRGQIDEEQTVYFPATKLFPGARLRLQIRRGLSDELTVLEVTLPPDFTPGKPIRLKGMGKQVGSWQGDLYLTLLAR